MNIPKPLITDISHGRCLPFIGAGFSKNALLSPGSSMPDWNELAKLLVEESGADPTLTPPLIAERYERRFGRVQLIEAIRTALVSGDPRPGEAHLAFADLPFETIYTTNFDLLLEEAYRERQRPYRSLVGELQMPFHAGQVAVNIVKMHGDLRHEEHVTVTHLDYDRFLSKYPVVATHLSAMLITRTPFFIGYSLSDPDFQNIRKVIRSRLGKFERMSYVIQFNQTPEQIELALDDHIHIISVDDKDGKTKSQLLKELFESIQSQIDTTATVRLRASRPEAFEAMEPAIAVANADDRELGPVVEATSTLCFVMMPFVPEMNIVYRELIRPVLEENGLEPVRADEMVATGSVIEQIRTAIRQSRVCVADLTYRNPNVLYELGLAQAFGKPTILISQSIEDVPFDVRQDRVIVYHDLEEAHSQLQRAIRHVLFDEKLKQAEEMYTGGNFRSAIAAAAVVLEHHLREMLKEATVPSLSIVGRFRSPSSAIEELVRQQKVSPDEAVNLREAVRIRNVAVHELNEPTAADAHYVIDTVRKFVNPTVVQLSTPTRSLSRTRKKKTN